MLPDLPQGRAQAFHFLTLSFAVDVQSLSCVQLFVTPRTVAHQAPLSMGFSGQEYWGGLLFPSRGDLPDSGIKSLSSALAGGFFKTEPPGKPPKLSFSSVQFSSVTQSCPTLCDPMNRSIPGLPIHHQLPEFTQTHVHRVGWTEDAG